MSSSKIDENIHLEEIIYKENKWVLKSEAHSRNPKDITPIPIGQPLIYRANENTFDDNYVRRLARVAIYNNPGFKDVNSYAFDKKQIDTKESAIAMQLYKI